MATGSFPIGASSTLTANSAINNTTMAGKIPTIWVQELLFTRESNLVAAKLFRRFNHRGKPGSTLQVPNVDDFTAQDKTTLTSVTIQSAVEGYKQISLNKHKEVSFIIEDLTALQAAYALRRPYTDKAMYAIAKAIDTDILALYSSLATGYKNIGSDGATAWDPTANANTGNGADLTDAGIRASIELLDNNDVPEEGRFLIIPPCQKSVLLGIDKFVLANYIGRTIEIQKGKFGSIYGLDVYVSTNCPQLYATDAATSYRVAIMGHKDAIWCAIQQDVRVQATYEQMYLGNLVTVDVIYGVKLMRGEANDTTNNRKSHAVALYVPA